MCTQKGKHCSLRVIVNSNRRIAPVTTASDPSTVVSDDVRDELIDLYLRSIHDKPHTLFHPASLKSRVTDGALPNAVLFSILSFAARLSTDRTARDRAESFFHTAKEALKKTIDEVTLDNIHATVLIGNICGAEGDSNAESLFFGIAFRMALILRLPEASPGDDCLTREIKLRTYWSLYMIDQWSSAGLDIPRQITDTNHHPLPMSESKFWSLQPGEQMTDLSASVQQPGLWGYMIVLVRIFGRIQELHRKLANNQLSDAEAEEYTRQLALEFEQFSHDLPPDVKFTRGSLKRHAMMGSGATFVALHLGYHHYSTLLYFHYLDSTHTQVPNQALFAARCKFHAAAFSDLLSSSNEIPGCEAVYFIVAHMTVISSSALLHTLLFGEPNELPDTRKRLFSNFQVLLKLKQYWPDVSKMVRPIYASYIWPAG
ncbi:hypothetical protein ATEIFO6365_0012022700 [Aspergillus terreus]|uniref:Xylanolytic transcriptional activator regulatory domain-containing protein n=1 Tax=Aspergillus terreus TaxID=33178 RepID=A0A5M3ZBB3_ASPTE|nr:hypothetical protein ATETN484_0013023700 [Aspergillus terreus]GFF20471.1 hypothetical protein ATEIFO6365_0012022700 [Aspergillus terreus]